MTASFCRLAYSDRLKGDSQNLPDAHSLPAHSGPTHGSAQEPAETTQQLVAGGPDLSHTGTNPMPMLRREVAQGHPGRLPDSANWHLTQNEKKALPPMQLELRSLGDPRESEAQTNVGIFLSRKGTWFWTCGSSGTFMFKVDTKLHLRHLSLSLHTRTAQETAAGILLRPLFLNE